MDDIASGDVEECLQKPRRGSRTACVDAARYESTGPRRTRSLTC